MALAVLHHDMRYTVYQNIRYTSGVGFSFAVGSVVGSPEGVARSRAAVLSSA